MGITPALQPLAVATPQKGIAVAIVVMLAALWVVFLVTENRRTAHDITESFLQAPNRKAPLDDEYLEGPRLDRFLTWALLLLGFIAVALPLYFLAEPGRAIGAIRGFDKRSWTRGEELFGAASTHSLDCASCHGPTGDGGVTTWSIAQFNPDGTPMMDSATGKQVLKQVTWIAPKISDVALRYRKGQLLNVLTYGRGANKPMPAWGTRGGGPADDQQLDDLVNYLRHLALEGSESAAKAYDAEWAISHDQDKAFEKAMEASAGDGQAATAKVLEETKAGAAAILSESEAKLAELAQRLRDAGDDAGKATVAKASLAAQEKVVAEAKAIVAAGDGELLFNQNCARCHTNGFSYGEPKEPGSGFYGRRLSEASLKNQFPDKADQFEYIKVGVDDQKAYGTGGVNHWSGGGMPYFANVLTDDQINQIIDYERSLK